MTRKKNRSPRGLAIGLGWLGEGLIRILTQTLNDKPLKTFQTKKQCDAMMQKCVSKRSDANRGNMRTCERLINIARHSFCFHTRRSVSVGMCAETTFANSDATVSHTILHDFVLMKNHRCLFMGRLRGARDFFLVWSTFAQKTAAESEKNCRRDGGKMTIGWSFV